MTEIYLHFLFAHYGLYGNAPVLVYETARAGGFTLVIARTCAFFRVFSVAVKLNKRANARTHVGLSYTTFEYSSLKLDKPKYQPCDPIMVTVVVKNTGDVASDEVVQVYVKQPHASVPAPHVRLAAFARCVSR